MGRHGRGTQLDRLDRIIDGCERGDRVVALINSPVGGGKSSFLTAFAERAAARQMRVLTLAARDDRRDRPAAGALVRRLLEGLGADRVPVSRDPEEAGHLLAQAVRGVPGPLALGIDDVHLSDDLSMCALGVLIRATGTGPMVLALTESPSSRPALGVLHAAALGSRRCHQLRLAPFDQAAVADLLAERLGVRPGADIVRICHRLSGGSPLLLQALIDDQFTAGVSAGRWEPDAAFRRAVTHCLHRVDHELRLVARALAVFGDAATDDLVGDLLASDIPTVRRATADLADVGLLGPEGFGHPAVRAVVLAGTPRPELARLRGRALALLDRSGLPPETLAEPATGAAGSTHVEILQETAAKALVAGDAARAVLYLGAAVARSGDDRDRAAIAAARAEAQWLIDPGSAALGLDELDADVRAGRVAGHDALVAVKLHLWHGDLARARELLEVAGGSRAADKAGLRLWTSILLPGAGEPATIEKVTYALKLLRYAAGPRRGHGVIRPVRAPRASPIDDPLVAMLVALVQLLRADPPEQLAEWTERLMDENGIRQVPLRWAALEIVEAATKLRRGNPASAAELVGRALQRVPLGSWGIATGVPLAIGLRAAAELGDPETLRQYLDHPLPAAAEGTPFAEPYVDVVEDYRLNCRGAVLPARARHGRSGWSAHLSHDGTSTSRPAGNRLRTVAVADIGDLTSAELRVAELAASGATNRKIAATLSVTVSTVEQHLTKIYRKLKVHGRSELSAALVSAEHGPR